MLTHNFCPETTFILMHMASVLSLFLLVCCYRSVFLNSGPQGIPPCMFSMFSCSSTPDSNEWVRGVFQKAGYVKTQSTLTLSKGKL